MPLLYFGYVKTADFGSEKKNYYNHFSWKKIAIFCGTFYFAPKPLKKSICGSLVATKVQSAKWTFVATAMLQIVCLSASGAK